MIPSMTPPKPKPSTGSKKPGSKMASRPRRRFSNGWVFSCVGAVLALAFAFRFVQVNHKRPLKPSASLDGNVSTPLAGSTATASATNLPPSALIPGASANSPLLDPNFKIPEDPVQLLNYGTELLDRGWVNEAITLYSKALQKNPDDEEIHFNLAFAYSRLGKTN